MAAPPAENYEKRRSLTMPRARIPEGDTATESSSASQSCDVADRRDADILTQAISTRSEEYRFLFRLPSDEVLLQDFNCAFQENILLQGHMYLFVHHICFYSNIFGFETKDWSERIDNIRLLFIAFVTMKIIPFNEVTCVRKAKTVAIFPNAIEIVAGPKKHFFGSFLSRDEAYRLIIDGWIQHGGDIRPIDTKSDANSQDNSIVGYEKVQGSRTSADDSSTTSDRSKDANVLQEFKPPPNGKVDDMPVKFSEVKENEFAEKSKESPSESPLSWVVEDMDAPTVPEYFTIVAESKFPLLVKDFFSLFVSDNAAGFVKDYHRRCGDKDFQCTSWRRHEQFGYTRNISFMHPVKIYLGAKYGSCQEVQKFRVYRNSHLVIETSQQIHDVPYGDYFEVEGIWDVVEDNNGENSCIVKVYSNVAFSKKTMFRGKIEQSTKEECREVYATWMSIAHEIVKEKNDVQLEGFLEQNTCIVQEIGNEFGSPPEFEASRESLTNTTNLTRSVHEIRSSNPLIENNMREKSENMTPVVTILGESWKTLLSYVKGQRLLPSVLAVAFFTLILMQLSIILLLTRAPEVHLVTRGNYISEVGTYNLENVEWLEKRFNYLKEEMLMMESRMERMRHEYALLKSHIQSLERLKAKS